MINPRIIVTLGRFSMRRWFPDGSITRIHGQMRNIGRGRVALAMFHPAAALRNPQWREAFVRDMRKLPPLIERARKANQLAARGKARPAGVPHPGDADFVESNTEPETEADTELNAESDTGRDEKPDSKPNRQPDAAQESAVDAASDDDASQLSLL